MSIKSSSSYGSLSTIEDSIVGEYFHDSNDDIKVNVLNRDKKPSTTLMYVVISISTIIGFALVLISNQNILLNSINKMMMMMEDGGGASVWTFNRKDYDPLPYFLSTADETLTYKFLDKYAAVIEPYTDTELYVEDYDATTNTDYYFEYELCEADNDSNCMNGKISNEGSESVYVKCQPYQEYEITVTKYSYIDGSKMGKTNGIALCMYVRREMRSLSRDDLDTTMDTMYALWTTNDEEGAKLYGDDYHSAEYFVKAHHFNAAWQDSDHIHEGLGFLPQHIKTTNMFEKSMQTVDPSASLPYWDFTIDYEEGEYIFTSFPFKEKTFGSIAEPADHTWGWLYKNDSIENAAIMDGRWKKIKASYNTDYPELNANFGYLRAPWNGNPSPYVSRFTAFTTELPSCSDHYKWLEYDTLTDFLTQAPYAPHASTHGAIGSVFGCDLLDDMTANGLIVDSASQIKLCQKWGFMMKELYRKNYITPRTDCSYSSLDYKGIDCSFTCNEEKSDTMTSQLEQLIDSRYVGDFLNQEQWGEWKSFVCEGDAAKIFVGDHVESASPVDPSFWPIHPTLERILHGKMMAGGFNDNSWPSDSQNDYVCDKFNCYEDGVAGFYDQCCYGHYEDDQMLDFISGDRYSRYGPTNRAIMDDTDPTSQDYAMRYIYDNFEWEHCEDSDNIKKLLTSSGNGKSKPSSRQSSNKKSNKI